MASSFGLTTEGLLVPTIDDIKGGIDQDFRDRYGPNFPLGESTFAGFLSGGLSERMLLLWDQLQRIYDSADRDKASGDALKALGLLSGTFAPVPSFSAVTLTLCGDPSTLVVQGFSARTPDTRRVFTTTDDATTVALPARASTTSYLAGARVTSSSRCYQCVAPGVSGAAGDAPVGTDLVIVDGAVTWTYVGEGTGAVDVASLCEVAGPVEAGARGITEIFTPTPGIDTCTNLLDAEPGADSLSEEDFRLLMEDEVSAPGTGTDDAVAADLRKLGGVTSVTVFPNDSEVTDADGVPAHSFETMVQGGDDQEIRDSILTNKPSGISTTGTVSGTALDAEGKPRVIRFSRPVEIPVYVTVTLTKNPRTYAGDDAVKIAVAGAARVIGQSVVSSRLSSLAFSVVGVVDVPRSGSLLGVLVSTAPSPTSDVTIPITSRQLATYDVSRVVVISSDAP